MIKVTVGNNVKRETRIVESSATVRSVLDEAGIDYTRGAMQLSGATLSPADFDKTFAQLGVTDSCYLINVAKLDNAHI